MKLSCCEMIQNISFNTKIVFIYKKCREANRIILKIHFKWFFSICNQLKMGFFYQNCV
jgi:hypothetical protein